MSRALTLCGLVVAAGLAALWAFGGFAALEHWAEVAQKDIQTTLAGAVRRLRGGQPGAIWAFLSVCFAYGFLHAAGPGHGKLVIGSYGVARRVTLIRLSVIALVSSLAQAAVAVGLVGAGFWAFGWGRDQTEATATRLIAPIGTLAIAGIGLWLMWRGAAGLWRQMRPDPAHHADHVHGPDCGHSHGPTVDQAAAVTSGRDALTLIFGIALRPCSGALLVLILCFQLGIAAAGIAGAFAMGFGTALVTLSVAALAIWGREGAFATLSGGRLAKALPLFELGAGALIAVTAAALLSQTL